MAANTRYPTYPGTLPMLEFPNSDTDTRYTDSGTHDNTLKPRFDLDLSIADSQLSGKKTLDSYSIAKNCMRLCRFLTGREFSRSRVGKWVHEWWRYVLASSSIPPAPRAPKSMGTPALKASLHFFFIHGLRSISAAVRLLRDD